MTETITHIAAKNISRALDHNSKEHFRVLPQVHIYEDGRGCLVIDAPHVSDAEVVTNDLVKMHSKTEFEWLGRFDNIINSGGVKLIPEVIEQKLSPLLLNRYFVAGFPDEKLGQKLVLVVEGDISETDLFRAVKNSDVMTPYEFPKKILTIPDFKETASGKIDRQKTIALLSKEN